MQAMCFMRGNESTADRFESGKYKALDLDSPVRALGVAPSLGPAWQSQHQQLGSHQIYLC